jgi:hypothetical protein
MKKLVLVAVLAFGMVNLLGASGGCGEEEKTCSAGSFSCGPGDGPAGGPACCRNGTSCCFGHGVCCDETKPHLGRRHSDGAKMCYANLNGVDETWTLLTVCGKPAN